MTGNVTKLKVHKMDDAQLRYIKWLMHNLAHLAFLLFLFLFGGGEQMKVIQYPALTDCSGVVEHHAFADVHNIVSA